MVSPSLRRGERSSKIELWRSQRGGGHTDGGTVVAVPSKIEKRWRPGKAFVLLCGGCHKWWCRRRCSVKKGRPRSSCGEVREVAGTPMVGPRQLCRACWELSPTDCALEKQGAQP